MKFKEIKEHKKQYLFLLLLADEQEDMIDRYLERGRMYLLEDHGVKGEEYDNVLFVMGRGWNLYKFEDTLYKDENTLHGKELEAYTRNRNLFYVCCSRPRKRLAILITVEINTQFEEYLQNIFGADNIVPYNEFMA